MISNFWIEIIQNILLVCYKKNIERQSSSYKNTGP